MEAEVAEVEAFVYFIKVKNGNWIPLSQWNATEVNVKAGKVKTKIIVKPEDGYITMTSASVPEWKALLKVSTSISQSSKKFLQFTEANKKKSATLPTQVVYGFGFTSEAECKECVKIIETAKNNLQFMKEQRPQNSQQDKAAMNQTCPGHIEYIKPPSCKSENNSVITTKEDSENLFQAHAYQENSQQIEAWQKDNDNLRVQVESLQEELSKIKEKNTVNEENSE